MIRKRDFNNILTKSPGDMKLLSIMNANEGWKKMLQGLQKSGGQEENKVLLGKKVKAINFSTTKDVEK